MITVRDGTIGMDQATVGDGTVGTVLVGESDGVVGMALDGMEVGTDGMAIPIMDTDMADGTTITIIIMPTVAEEEAILTTTMVLEIT